MTRAESRAVVALINAADRFVDDKVYTVANDGMVHINDPFDGMITEYETALKAVRKYLAA